MHIPIQVDYGIRALVDLAERDGEGPVRATDIARRRSTPEPYLARVLHTLQKSGVVKSQRGPQGGHMLAKDPSEITMGMVMTALGGTQTLVGCLDDAATCNQGPSCMQREVWQEVEDAMNAVLDSTSIADLVERTRLPSNRAGARPAQRRVAVAAGR